MKRILLYLSLIFLFSATVAFAKNNISINSTDITFSQETILDGDTVKIYARIFNKGDADTSGTLDFFGNTKEIGKAQFFVKPNSYDDVFVTWTAKAGTYTIEAKITSPADNSGQNTATRKDIIVQEDTNHNNIPDSQETKTPTVDQISDKNAALFGGIQDDIANFSDSNPIKSALDTFDKNITQTWHKLFNDPKEVASLPATFSSWVAGLSNPFTGRNRYLVWGLTGLAIIILYFLFFRKKD